MTSTLTPLLIAFVAAKNSHDSSAFTACFAPNAVVHDERRVHRGRPAIKAWFESVSLKYRSTLVVTEVEGSPTEMVLTGNVSGDFEGSPVRLRYRLTVHDDHITALTIAP